MNEQTMDLKEKKWAFLIHMSVFAGLFFPFGNLLAPLTIWFIKMDESSFLKQQGEEVLNFQISVFIYLLAGGLVTAALIGVAILIDTRWDNKWVYLAPALSTLFLLGTLIWGAINVIRGAMAAYAGRAFRFPLTIRFI